MVVALTIMVKSYVATSCKVSYQLPGDEQIEWPFACVSQRFEAPWRCVSWHLAKL